jgi:hypothetical protein
MHNLHVVRVDGTSKINPSRINWQRNTNQHLKVPRKKIKKKTHLTSAHTHLAALLLEAACALLGPFPAELGSSLLVSGVTLGTTLYFQKKSELHARYKTKLLDSCIFVNKELILSHKALKACKKK